MSIFGCGEPIPFLSRTSLILPGHILLQIMSTLVNPFKLLIAMQQRDPQEPTFLKMKVLLQQEVDIPLHGKADFMEKIIPLNENAAFLYTDDGSYEVCNIQTLQLIGQGKIPENIKVFLQIYHGTILFFDPIKFQIRLLNLNTNQIDEKFVITPSTKVNSTSDQQKKEGLAEKLKLMVVDGHDCKYLITQDLEKAYSNENGCDFRIWRVPQVHTPNAEFETKPWAEYRYTNSKGCCDLFNWQIDPETYAIFGQDFEPGQAEFLLCKPHLKEKAFKLIPVKEKETFTLVNVTNWINPNQIAIWQNNNDGNAKPTIFILDMRSYYDGVNWIDKGDYKAEQSLTWQVEEDNPQTFVDVFSFPFNQDLCLQQRMVGVDMKLSLVNMRTKTLVNEFELKDFFQEFSANKEYMISYNDSEIKREGDEQNARRHIKIKTVFGVDARYSLIHYMQKKRIHESYGQDVVEKIIEFYK